MDQSIKSIICLRMWRGAGKFEARLVPILPMSITAMLMSSPALPRQLPKMSTRVELLLVSFLLPDYRFTASLITLVDTVTAATPGSGSPTGTVILSDG